MPLANGAMRPTYFAAATHNSGTSSPQRDFIRIAPRLQRPIDRRAVERAVVGNEKIALDPDDEAEPKSSATYARNSLTAKHEPKSDQRQRDARAREQQRANEHAERRAEFGFVAGKDRVGAEQAERKDDEQGRGDDGVSRPASDRRSSRASHELNTAASS